MTATADRPQGDQGQQLRPDDGHLAPDDPRKPSRVNDVHKPTWLGILKRTGTEFKADQCTDLAAALTYYLVLAIFPAIIVMVALVGLIGQGERTVEAIMQILQGVGAGSAVSSLRGPIEEVAASRSGTGALFSVGLLGALWSSSGYVGAFFRAANRIYEVEEARPFWKVRPLQILLTVVGVVGISAIALSATLSGGVAEAIGNTLGIGGPTLTVWNIAKWPVMIVVLSLMISLLYWAAPNVKQPRFRWFTLGGLLGLLLWVVAAAGFGFYVANFSSFDRTYGSLGAVIAFLVFVWISNNALLFGAELNAELERSRELQAGVPEEETLNLPPRADPADRGPGIAATIRDRIGRHSARRLRR
jgi:membrane protein